MSILEKINKNNFSIVGDDNLPIYSGKHNALIDQVNSGTTNILTGKLFTPEIISVAGANQTVHASSGKCLIAHGATAALATLTVVITNNLVTENSVVMVSIADYGGTGIPLVKEVTPTANTITVEIYNAHAADALSANFNLVFAILG